MVFTLDPHKPGPFEFEVELYLEDPGLRESNIKVSGTALAAESATH